MSRLGEFSSSASGLQPRTSDIRDDGLYEHRGLWQQGLPACRCFLSPLAAALIYAPFAAFSVIIGIVMFIEMHSVCEISIPYPKDCSQSCSVTFKTDIDHEGPFFIYYQIDGMYQSNSLYGSSKNTQQLNGLPPDSVSDLDTCDPKITDGGEGLIYAPCGAVAMSVFNDTFTFGSEFPEVSDKEITLRAFRDRFKAPNEYYDTANKWMNESMFPGGQVNERFVNWMHLGAFYGFRKLWGRTDKSAKLLADVVYNVTIENNYPVESFGGEKTLIIAKAYWFGGNNMFLSLFFMATGALLCSTSITFLVVYCTRSLPVYQADSFRSPLKDHLYES